MQLLMKPINEERAKTILGWKYEQPYDFYDNELTAEALQEMLDGSYHALVDEQNTVIGFFCTGANAQVPRGHQFGVYTEDFIDMGVGMHPNLVGKGNGFDFCAQVISCIRAESSKPIRLTVATFNKRAIRLYEKLGFVSENRFCTDSAEFETMVKKQIGKGPPV